MNKIKDTAQPIKNLTEPFDSADDKKPISEVNHESKPTLTLEQVRAELAKKCLNGNITSIQNLLKKYNASKLSQVNSKDYEAIVKDAEELNDDTLKSRSYKEPAMNFEKENILWRNTNMNKNVKPNNAMKVITGPETRWSYVNVWEPKSINGGTPKFSVSLLINKKDDRTLSKIKAAIETAYKEGETKLKGSDKSVPPLSAIKTPLRDGDTERPNDPAYAGCFFINANASSAPGIVDINRNPILTHSEVYSGVYGRASITFYAFNSSGNRGIACGLNNLQKIRDGEPLGSKASAQSDFSTDEDDEFLN